MGAVGLAQAVLGAVGLDDFVAAPLQQDRDQLHRGLFIINHQDFLGHRAAPFSGEGSP